MSNVLSISTLTPKVSAWPSTFHTGRMNVNAAGEKGTFIFYCDISVVFGANHNGPKPYHQVGVVWRAAQTNSQRSHQTPTIGGKPATFFHPCRGCVHVAAPVNNQHFTSNFDEADEI